MSATTIYDVVTRYRTDAGQAAQQTKRYGDEALRTGRSLGFAQQQSGSLVSSLVLLGARVGGIASIGLVIQRTLTATFRNLNLELDTSLSLAAQLNLAFKWSVDPGKNFQASLVASKQLLRDIADDAARLPGTAAEYYGIAGAIANTVTAGGGDLPKLREMTSLIGVTAPFAGVSRSDAANEAFRMLLGTASIGDNPLYARLLGGGLFSPGMTTTKFNQLDAGKRLDEVYNALHRIVTPNYLEAIVRTFDTQLGTLAQTIVGSTGILSQAAGRDIFDSLLDGLTNLNTYLDQNGPEIARNLRGLADSIGWFSRSIVDTYDSIPQLRAAPWPGASFSATEDFQAYADVWNSQKDATKADFLALAKGLIPGTLASKHFIAAERHRFALERSLERYDPIAQEPTLGMTGGTAGALRTTTPAPPVVHQTNYITVDLKSDDSPEAIAVKLGKAMEIAERHPKRSVRAISLMPGSSVYKP